MVAFQFPLRDRDNSYFGFQRDPSSKKGPNGSGPSFDHTSFAIRLSLALDAGLKDLPARDQPRRLANRSIGVSLAPLVAGPAPKHQRTPLLRILMGPI